MWQFKPRSQEEIDILRNFTVELDNGKRGYAITCKEDEKGVWAYTCHVCQNKMYGWTVVNQHMCGKKHTANMQKSYHPYSNFTRFVDRIKEEGKPPAHLHPSKADDPLEQRKCIIQTKLDAYKEKALIGIEYVVELLEEFSDPLYYCLLCDKQGVSNNIIVHLTSQPHYLKYLQKYYTTLYSTLSLVPRTPEYKKGFTIIISRIINEIEKKNGRLKPRQHGDCQIFFERDKADLLKTVENEDQHFRETIFDNYVDMVNWAEMLSLQFEDEKDDIVNIVNDPVLNFKLEKEPKSLSNKVDQKSANKLQLRKDRTSIDNDDGNRNKNREKSPDVTKQTKKPTGAVKKKCVSISKRRSSSSSSSCSCSRSPARKRSRYRRNSRSRSPLYRKKKFDTKHCRRSQSRSRSRSGERHYRKKGRSRSTSGTRFQRRKRNRSPPLLRLKSRKLLSKSRSKSPESKIPYYQRDLHHRKPCVNNEIEKEKSINIVKNSPKEDTTKVYKWEMFTKELERVIKGLDDKLKYYEANPENHPQYSDEWKFFWSSRYKQLIGKGEDPSKHDFKSEWIEYWSKRMRQIHDEELKKGKDKLKLVFHLENEVKKKESGTSVELEKKNDITVDDNKTTASAGAQVEDGNKLITEDVGLLFDESHLDKTLSPKSNLLSTNPPPGARQGFIPFNDNAPKVISVLRLICVLEAQLGSLGPKIVDLLSKAIAMEKNCKGSSEDILCDEEQCVLLGTVKEKLKGMLFAGLVDWSFVNITKQALKNIEDLFLCASELVKKGKASSASPAPSQSPTSSVTVPGLGTVDTVAFAQQIAGALIAQGKTDVTENQLKQLINAVVGMAQAATSSATPITTAQYVQQFQNPISDANDNSNFAASKGLQLLLAAYQEARSRENSDSKPAVPVPSGETTTVTSGESKGLQLLLAAYQEGRSRENSDLKPVLPIPSGETTDSLNKCARELSDTDLKCLLENFIELSNDERTKLIAYFRKLERTDPERILLLWKTIDFNVLLDPDAGKMTTTCSGRSPPVSVRSGASNPSTESDHQKISKLHGSDYSIEDVYEVASEKLRQQEMTQERKKIESMLAYIASAAKKGGDALANLATSFQISLINLLNNKGFHLAERKQPNSYERLPFMKDLSQTSNAEKKGDAVQIQVPNPDSQNTSGEFNRQRSFQPPAIESQNSRVENDFTYDRGAAARPYNSLNRPASPNNALIDVDYRTTISNIGSNALAASQLPPNITLPKNIESLANFLLYLQNQEPMSSSNLK